MIGCPLTKIGPFLFSKRFRIANYVYGHFFQYAQTECFKKGFLIYVYVLLKLIYTDFHKKAIRKY